MKVLPQAIKQQLGEWRARVAYELANDAAGGLSGGNEVEIFFDGDLAYAAMHEAIRAAKTRVHLEMYMFLSDTTGWKFARVLIDKAREGIPVKVIYDAIGSSDADDMMWGEMRAAGVTVEEYRPVSLWRKRGLWWWRGSLLGRNHRKNLVVDGRVGFTGGMNIGDMWSETASAEDAWRDTQVRVIGSAATHLDELFCDSWEFSNGEKIDLLEYSKTPSSSAGSQCLVVGSRGLGSRKEMRTLFSVHLNRARRSVRMTMPYFVPPRRLRKAMKNAQQRGVAVEALVPRDSDVAVVDWLREGLYPKMLDWGVRVIEYLGPVLHAKTMVVDGEVGIIGSNNFDLLSILMNREVALVVMDEDACQTLERQWDNDLMLSEKVNDNWKGIRPWWRLLLARVGCLLLRRL